MKILAIDKNNPDPTILSPAATIIQNGGIVIFPCDTSYGLAADYLNDQAVNKVFSLKGRIATKELSVIVRDLPMIEIYCQVSDQSRQYLNHHLPGIVTFILPLKQPIRSTPTLGIRIPDLAITKQLSQFLDNPYTATSANPSGQPPAHTRQEVLSYFANVQPQPDLFLDAGDLAVIPSSTVVDLTSPKPVVRRQGSVTIL